MASVVAAAAFGNCAAGGLAADEVAAKDAEAMAHHKTLPHYKAWADFKAANMDTVGASQKVEKFKMIAAP